MATIRLTGTEVSRIDTGGFFWSALFSCASRNEDFFFWFDNNSGELFRATLPNLTGQTSLGVVPNYGASRATVAHPANNDLLVYFNTTDGVNTIHTGTGVITQLLTTAAFNALLNVGSLEMANISRAKLNGSRIILQGESDPTGSWWEYDPVAGTAVRRFVMNSLSRVSDLGPDPATELVLSGYTGPNNIFFIVDLTKDQVRVLAGVGTSDAMVDGDALTVAAFEEIRRIFRAGEDLYYVVDFNNTVRWIQGGLVGRYPQDILGGGFMCAFLPGLNLAVSVGVQSVIVWS
jgi:hypothetical protein